MHRTKNRNFGIVSCFSHLFTIVFLFSCSGHTKVREIIEELMEEICKEIKTLFKYGLVMVSPNDDFKMDCPTKTPFTAYYRKVHVRGLPILTSG